MHIPRSTCSQCIFSVSFLQPRRLPLPHATDIITRKWLYHQRCWSWFMDALLLCWPLRIFFELKQQFHKMWSNTNILSRLCSTYGRYIILKLIDTWNSNDIDILRCYQINPSVPRFSRLTQLACHKQDKMKWNLSS